MAIIYDNGPQAQDKMYVFIYLYIFIIYGCDYLQNVNKRLYVFCGLSRLGY